MGEKILIIGCGGLGCELIKLLSKNKNYMITLIDDDTIDKTNLNRQFLFTKEDVGKPKAATVAKKMQPFFSEKIEHYFCKIDKFKHIDFYRNFDVIYNCLDNDEARLFINERCYSINALMIDGGSAGWLGQSFINIDECFDCLPKRIEKVYPVCTVRQVPKDFKHCLVWGKAIVEEEDFEGFQEEKTCYMESGFDPREHKSNGDVVLESDSYILLVNDDTVNSNILEIDKNEDINNESSDDCKIDIIDNYKSKIRKTMDNGKYYKSTSFERAIVDDALKLTKKDFLDLKEDDKVKLIYNISMMKAVRFKLDSMSFIEAQTFLKKIIPSISSTNSIVASMMIFSKFKRMNYFLTQGSSIILRTEPNQSTKECLTCSLPIYEILFPRHTKISDFFRFFKNAIL